MTSTQMTANGAESIFGTIPGAGGLSGDPESWDVIENVFDYAFQTFPGADLGWVPTLEQAKQIRTEVVGPMVTARHERRPSWRPGKRWGIPSNYDPERIQDMFERWNLYYPFVDRVAVSKAVEFHAEAWAGLTAREHRAAVAKLATMWDPWETNNINHVGYGRPLVTTMPRAHRWMSHSPEERKVLIDAVQRWKRTNGV
jgi:hypothetical protein